MKAIRIFFRNVGSALKSISRNLSLSMASIICTSITLLIVGIAFVLSANINGFTKDLESSLAIFVYVDKDATEEEIEAVKSKLLEIKNIKSDQIIYKSKAQLKDETLSNTDKNSALYTIVNSWTEENNPLKPEYLISVKEIEELASTAETIRKINKVDSVQYSEDVVDNMIPVFNVVEKVTWIIIIGLIVVTIFLICNTIRLTIFARKSEIEIMRLVGISNFVIKLPFVIEGLFLGLIGAIVPVTTIILGYIIAYDKMDHHLFTNLITMIEPMPFVIYVSLILVALGAVIGMIGSYGTVRKYLKI